ncbi:uncharacterized protein VP01_1624g2 [Puccinia sorghi]|uniref:Retrotransposon gag domain-containing protein n=1 Tax=Puccinia sorghi TaxID=27349 RepID=A0A0L6VGX1_9BASI|nr:uncharacterized protein VP01_1624g2 [Puccinia sorghi]
MDALNARLDKMMRMLAKERTKQLATGENLHQTQARLNATPKLHCPSQAPTFQQNPSVVESFVGQILLHTVTYPEQFPTNSSKVAFAILFMTDYAATWSQPYLMKVFNTEEVVFNKFLDDFKSSFFDHNRQNHAEVSLQSLRQTGTVSVLKFWAAGLDVDNERDEEF